jgi:hypothetical protein
MLLKVRTITCRDAAPAMIPTKEVCGHSGELTRMSMDTPVWFDAHARRQQRVDIDDPLRRRWPEASASP